MPQTRVRQVVTQVAGAMQLAVGSFNNALNFWQEQYADYRHPEPLHLDMTSPAAAGTTSLVDLILGAADLQQLRQLAAANSSSVAKLVTAAVVIAVTNIAQQRDLLLGMIRKNRRHPGLQDTVGSLLDVMPLRVQPPDDGSLHGTVREVAQAISANLTQWAPGSVIAQHCRLDEPSRSMYSVLMNYRYGGSDGKVIDLGDARAEPLSPLLANSGLPHLAAHCRESDDLLEINILHRHEFLSPAAGQAFAKDLQVSSGAIQHFFCCLCYVAVVVRLSFRLLQPPQLPEWLQQCSSPTQVTLGQRRCMMM